MNKRGFTIVELIMSFIFVTIVSISMYGLVVDYRNRTSTEAVRNELNNFKTKLAIDIQKDIEKYFLNKIDYCKDAGNNIIPKCIELSFNNGDVKNLSVGEDTVEDTIDEESFTYNVPYIMYGDVKYTIPDGRFVRINGDFLLNFTTSADDVGTGIALYRITISFKHEEIDESFNMRVTAQGKVNSNYGVPGSYTEYNTIGQLVNAKVGSSTYQFIVIKASSSSDSKVTLLYNGAQIGPMMYYTDIASGNKYDGSLVDTELKNATSSWSNPITIRLLTAEELAFIADSCPRFKSVTPLAITIPVVDRPWLSQYSYWTMTPVASDSTKAWYVSNTGVVSSGLVDSAYYIRPVIVISKEYVS